MTTDALSCLPDMKMGLGSQLTLLKGTVTLTVIEVPY